MTLLTDSVVAAARTHPIAFGYEGRTLFLRHTNARNGLTVADLEVVEGETVLGYITPYERIQYGAIPVRFLGHTLPKITPTVEEALTEICR